VKVYVEEKSSFVVSLISYSTPIVTK